jgi:hypothetical protein
LLRLEQVLDTDRALIGPEWVGVQPDDAQSPFAVEKTRA